MNRTLAIVEVYGKLNGTVKLKEEEISGWEIEDLTKEELLDRYTLEEIEAIYDNDDLNLNIILNP